MRVAFAPTLAAGAKKEGVGVALKAPPPVPADDARGAEGVNGELGAYEAEGGGDAGPALNAYDALGA